MPREINLPFTQICIGRFFFLLISIVFMLVLNPFLEGFVGIRLLMDVFVTLILLSGIYAASQKKHIFYIALLIAFPTLIAYWLSHFVGAPVFFLLRESFGALFFTFMVVIILNYLFTEKEITADVIAGAICVYLLIGMMWASFFGLLEILQPASFRIPEDLSTGSSYFMYYSYVTLTTLGYGDITPVTNQARSLSFLEAIAGQVYLVTLVARLVALHISQSMGEKSS